MSQGERLAVLVPCDFRAWVSMNFAGEGDASVECGADLAGVPARDLWGYCMKVEVRHYTGDEHRQKGGVGRWRTPKNWPRLPGQAWCNSTQPLEGKLY